MNIILLLLATESVSSVSLGILTVPAEVDSSGNVYSAPRGSSILLDSYVRYMQQAGARIIPIPYSSSPQEIEELFNSVQGILLVGGSVQVQMNGDYMKAAQLLYNLVIQANQSGKYTPMLGICLGLQVLHNLTAGRDILESFDAWDYSKSIYYTEFAQNSRLFGKMPNFSQFVKEIKTFYAYDRGLGIFTYQQVKELNSFYHMLALSSDCKGKVSVVATEAKEFPIYAVLFHPEVAMSDSWSVEQEIEHNLYFANFFVREAAKNPNTADVEEFEIKNYAKEYWPSLASHVYIFKSI